MSSVNKAIIVGRLGQDPSMRFTKNGDGVCSFSMATSEKWKDKSGEKNERTTWHRIVIWRKLGEVAAEYLKKGSQVYIEGRIEHREYEDNDGNKRTTTEIVANNMTMLGQGSGQGGEQSGGQGGGQSGSSGGSSSGGYGGGDEFEDDDIPF